MNGYQIAFTMVLCSMVFWCAVLLVVVAMLSTNLVTFKFQIVTPPRPRRKIKRLTGVPSESRWDTIESWSAAGWDLLLDEEHGVRMHTLILEKKYA